MKKITFLLSVFIVCITLISCKTEQKQQLPLFSIWSGDHFMKDKTDEEIGNYLKQLQDAKIFGLFLGASNENYQRIIPLAKQYGIQIHAWRWTMNDGKFLNDHPEYYQVNRLGESCATNPPYVDYYRWMCPNDTNVQKAVTENYLTLAAIEGLSSVHFDYVRFCDVFLPVGLQPKYNLVQDHIMPEFDYCYCNRCLEKFKTQTGLDAMNLTSKEDSTKWLNFRLASVVTLVNNIAEKVHQQSKTLVTAAVFPTPAMSAHMVRQDWGKFKIDAVFPMIYNGFYNESFDWVGQCVKEGIETMEVKKDLVAGIFAPDCKTPQDLEKVINIAMQNGAKGVSMFDFPLDNPEFIKTIQQSYQKYNVE